MCSLWPNVYGKGTSKERPPGKEPCRRRGLSKRSYGYKYSEKNNFFSTISKFDAMVRSAIAKIGQNRTRVNLNSFFPSLRLSSFYSHYVGLRTSPQQLIHYDIGIHCSRQFSHVGSLFISSSVSCFVNCSPRQLVTPTSVVRQSARRDGTQG